MYNTIQIIRKYTPYNQQEQKDKDFMLKANQVFNGDILNRSNVFCHVTASAFVVNENFTKVLCCFHNIYKSWGWVGGHADGIDNPAFVAQKEAKEETGIDKLKLAQSQPISIDVLVTDGHVKHGEYVSAHTHMNICYLFVADEHQPLKIREDENSSVGWIEIDELVLKAREECMKEIYKKIIEKIKNIKKNN